MPLRPSTRCAPRSRQVATCDHIAPALAPFTPSWPTIQSPNSRKAARRRRSGNRQSRPNTQIHIGHRLGPRVRAWAAFVASRHPKTFTIRAETSVPLLPQMSGPAVRLKRIIELAERSCTNVWSGRASQEGSSSWRSGLAQMYPASDWSSLLRAIMDISARAI